MPRQDKGIAIFVFIALFTVRKFDLLISPIFALEIFLEIGWCWDYRYFSVHFVETFELGQSLGKFWRAEEVVFEPIGLEMSSRLQNKAAKKLTRPICYCLNITMSFQTIIYCFEMF